ncbi:MAG: site-2 protease family protein [Acidimicrobiia bacterium]|nr:site-2 protease family protein [Acidimicrobiia bacterium]
MTGLRLGRIGGVAVVVDLSWVLIGIGIATALYLRIASDAAAGRLVPALVAVAGALLVLGSVVVHEVSHALVARRLGIGVVSVSLFVFGGYSELEGEPARPRDEVLVAGAGPVASLLLAGLLAAMAALVPDGVAGAAEVLGLLAVVNLAVALFNLLPGLPLDGGRLLRSAIWRLTADADRATRLSARAGIAIGVAVGLSGPVGLAASGSWVWLWNAAVGIFLVRVAWEAERSLRPLAMPAGAVVDRSVPVVGAEDPVADALDALGGRPSGRPAAVLEAGRVVGLVDRSALEAAGGGVVGGVMQTLEPGDVVDASARLGEALQRTRDGRFVVVVKRGRTIGVLGPVDRGIASEQGVIDANTPLALSRDEC